ncbi:MAG: anion permease, partial [Ardenticatenia bacterium]|nr:anion permease [Ardenticatenia bacterium]
MLRLQFGWTSVGGTRGLGMNPMWLAGGIFLITYALIVTERVHRTVSALLGGFAMIVVGVLPQGHALEVVDWNVIFLLMGMMIIANVLRETGLFQWVAIRAVRLGGGSPFRTLIILSLITAIGSALLDNVTMVVLVAPVTLFIAAHLSVSPVPFLIAEILASNIGGMATLIGDPPNILIGSAAGLDFLAFLFNTGPISLIILLAFLGLSWFLFKKDLQTDSADTLDVGILDTSELITNRPLLFKSLVVLAAVVVGFVVHGIVHLEPATIAMGGATLLLLWTRSDPHHVLQDREYAYPYHYIPTWENGQFSQVQYWSWGYRYLGGIQVVLDQLRKLSFETLVDIGCGDGRFLREAKARFPEARMLGVDYS